MIDKLAPYLVRVTPSIVLSAPKQTNWWQHPDAQGICADIAQCLLNNPKPKSNVT
jgi:hypothetical protein